VTRALQIEGGDQSFLRSERRPMYAVEAPPLRLVDLFAGCGGLSLGVLEACRALKRPLEIALAVETAPEMWGVYAANLKPRLASGPSCVHDWISRTIRGPLSKREIATKAAVGVVDLLVGGPPCQGHSTLNNYTRGDDPKNALYLAMVRAAEVFEPTGIIIENVPSLERDSSGVLERAIRRLEGLDYKVEKSVVRLEELGVPQLRRRHVLVASRSRDFVLEDALKPAATTKPRALRWAIGDLQKLTAKGQSRGLPLFDRPAVLSPENLARARWFQRSDKYDLPNRLRPPCHRDKPDHKYKSMYGRLNWTSPAQTITSGFGSPGQGRYFHPEQLRALTPHEAARLQFFPDWFDFSSVLYKTSLGDMIGNAVPPKLGFVLARHLLAISASAEAHQQVSPLAATG